jgi:tetratricopeptide (TPR) repeat protein
MAVLEVLNDDTGLVVRVDDFIPGSPNRLESRLVPIAPDQLATSIPNVTLEYPLDQEPVAATLTLNWMGTRQVLDRAPPDYTLPMELFSLGRVDEAVRALAQSKELYLAEVPDLEVLLNRFGYESLRAGKTAEAIHVFELNGNLFPESSNVWDSLGEAYMEAGEAELAMQNYLKSLELNPDNVNAKDMLQRLGYDP